MHANQARVSIERIEKYLSGKMTNDEARDYIQELQVKFMSPEEKQEWADGAADRNERLAKEKEAKKQAQPKKSKSDAETFVATPAIGTPEQTVSAPEPTDQPDNSEPL